MEALKLEAKTRDVAGKKVKKLRSAGLIPAVVYGHGVSTRNVAIEYGVFEKLFKRAGESSLVDLSIGGAAPVKVLIQDVSCDPLKGSLVHVDFREVKMTEKLEADIILRFVGEAPAVKELGAILVRNMGAMPVRCLPQYLVHEIDVDLSRLKSFGDNIKVKDISPPEGMEFLAKPDDLIIVVNEPISEAELAELESKPVEDVSAVKVAEKEKKEEEGEAGKE